MSKYKFNCAGTFAGVSSFTDDDGEAVNLLKIDYMGGKVNVQLSPETAEKFQKKQPGCDCRVSGDVLVGGGSFKPVLSSIQFEGEKDFEPVSMEESFAGLIFTGPGVVESKRSYTSKSGNLVCLVDVKLFGASLKDFEVSSEVFPQIAEGQVTIFGQIVSEVKKTFKGDLISKNWLTIFKARPLGETSKRR